VRKKIARRCVVRAEFVMLVAEDDSSDLALLTHALSDVGTRVDLQVTRDGEEVVRYLQGAGEFSDRDKHPLPDLVVLDLKMPQLSGLEVLRWMKNHSDFACLPKIILSGSSVERDIEEAYAEGVNTFFTKPSGFHELHALVKYIVGYWSRSQRPVATTQYR